MRVEGHSAGERLGKTQDARCKDQDMFKRKMVKKVDRLVWRMSATNLAGEFVSPSSGRMGQAPGVAPAEAHERGLRASSAELCDGSEVTETDFDTLPGELAEAFLKDRE
jgi:hypothetical protein